MYLATHKHDIRAALLVVLSSETLLRIAAFDKKRFLRNLHKSKAKFFYFFSAYFSQQEFPEYCTRLRIYLSLTFLYCSEEADYGQLT